MKSYLYAFCQFVGLFHHSYPQNPTIADVLFKTTFLENWGSGVGRMVDTCKKANLPEPEFNQNAAFVWVTFKREFKKGWNPAKKSRGQVKNHGDRGTCFLINE
jgi:predicted HTH transcriptional regulator